MYTLHTLILSHLQTNCYIVADKEKNCIIIDPAGELSKITALLDKHQLTPKYILLTHGHFDHVLAAANLRTKYAAPIYINRKDEHYLSFPVDGYLKEGMTFELAETVLEILHTPGHTPGSVCIKMEEVIFSGDTLFQGTCGRCDLPGGNYERILQSLVRLKELEGDYTVYTGHGKKTTLDAERYHNPYMNQ